MSSMQPGEFNGSLQFEPLTFDVNWQAAVAPHVSPCTKLTSVRKGPDSLSSQSLTSCFQAWRRMPSCSQPTPGRQRQGGQDQGETVMEEGQPRVRCQDYRFHELGTSNLLGMAQPCPFVLTRVTLDDAQDTTSISKR